MKTLTPIDPDIPLLEAVVYAKDQPQYIPLPVRRTQDGEVVSRWKPNWRARIAVLFGADFYLTMLTFNGPLTPVRVAVDKPLYVEYKPCDVEKRCYAPLGWTCTREWPHGGPCALKMSWWLRAWDWLNSR
jgi:hypothetical protein